MTDIDLELLLDRSEGSGLSTELRELFAELVRADGATVLVDKALRRKAALDPVRLWLYEEIGTEYVIHTVWEAGRITVGYSLGRPDPDFAGRIYEWFDQYRGQLEYERRAQRRRKRNCSGHELVAAQRCSRCQVWRDESADRICPVPRARMDRSHDFVPVRCCKHCLALPE